jgi:AraC-like DNA-binding protein
VYRERPSTLAGVVAWTNAPRAPGWVLPDGCMDLIWDGELLFVAGPDTTPKVVGRQVGTPIAGLRFEPGMAPKVLGHPAHVLRDERVPLADLWGDAAVRPLVDRLGEGGDPLVALEAVTAPFVLASEPRDGLLAVAVERLRRGDQVAAVAEAVGLSERQLHRRALDAFGYGPKVLARILRLQAALAMVRRGIAAAVVAAETGFADQAHLAREVRALAGTTVRELVS